MNISNSNQYGKIDVSIQAIADLVGNTLCQVYGVLGLVNRKNLKHPLLGILKPETFADGITILKAKNNFEISVFLIVSKEVKISEVVSEVQKQLAYVLNKTFGIKPNINVYIHALQ